MRCFCVIETLCGNLLLVQQGDSIIQISFCQLPSHAAGTSLLCLAAQQIQEYFTANRTQFSFPIALQGTEFQQKVWQALQKIPYGETRSYQEIAKEIGNEKAMRAVGMANHCNPIAIVVPCHRVVGKNGGLTGYAAGLHRKQLLLELEEKNKASAK